MLFARKFQLRLVAGASFIICLLFFLLHFRLDTLDSSRSHRTENRALEAKALNVVTQRRKQTVPDLLQAKALNVVTQRRKPADPDLTGQVNTYGDKKEVRLKFSCQSTPVNNAVADIHTLNFWEKIKFTEGPMKYNVAFDKKRVYEKRVSNEHLTVLLVPHSHNDPGWQETVQDYYTYSTREILNNIVKMLRKYPKMRMIWAETVFLSMWYDEASSEQREALKVIVDNGQLDIVTGGWVMPDEASTHYYSIIDQLIEGHQWLYSKLGVKTRINWSIDPFGHSGTVPYIWKMANFKNIVVQRVHQAIKDYLGHQQQLEFYWRQIWDVNGQNDIFTHIMPYVSYDTADTCGPDKMVCMQLKFMGRRRLDLGIPGTQEFKSRLESFTTPLYEQFRKKASNFQHNVIFVPLGGDFAWQYPIEWEVNLNNFTSIMDFMNSKREWNMDIRFGTLSEYFDLIEKTSIPEPNPTLTGDFFVYSETPGQYWSGYFTTRPLDKFLGREVQSALQAADIIHVLATLYSPAGEYPAAEAYKSMEISRRDLALFQHHDAITGTAKSHAVADYEARLARAFLSLQNTIAIAMLHLLDRSKGDKSPIPFKIKDIPDALGMYTNEFVFKLTDPVTKVVVFNPTVFRREQMISIVVDEYRLKVAEFQNPLDYIPHQINPIWKSGDRLSTHSFQLSFPVNLAPWSVNTFCIYKDTHPKSNLVDIYTNEKDDVQVIHQLFPFRTEEFQGFQNFELENDCMKIKLSLASAMIANVLDKRSGVDSKMFMEMLSYKPGPMTGAYLLNLQGPPTLLSGKTAKITYEPGELFSSVRILNRGVQTTIKLHKATVDNPNCWAFSVENVVTSDRRYRENEIVMRLKLDIDNGNVLYTDGNGLSMVKHRRFGKLPKSAAFYPMTTMASIEDRNKRFTIHAAQPLAVASLETGTIEVLLDRTFRSDDGKGLNQGVWANEPTPSKFLLHLEHGLERDVTFDNEIFYPTLESWRLNDILQNPLRTALHNMKLYHTFNPQIASFPCDANVVSWRNLKSEETLTSAFILQKRGFLCGSNSLLTCSNDWTNFTFESVFSLQKPRDIKEMSLSLIDFKRTIDLNSPLDLQTMHLKSYSLSWGA